MAEPARCYAGIAWTPAGFEVAVLDKGGQPVRPLARFGPGQQGELTGYLAGLAPGSGEPLVAVLDSTNGVLDGTLLAAGLPVYRADPWLLPGRPLLGSVPAQALADAGRHGLAALSRLTARGGTLTGRGAEHRAGITSSRAQATALTGAGRLARHGRRLTPAGAAPEVALTFDDGPNPPYTGQILGILARYQVPATFFCVGLQASAHPADVARMAAAGHGLGNHTWSHPFLPDLTRAQLAEQLDRTDEAVSRAARTIVQSRSLPVIVRSITRMSEYGRSRMRCSTSRCSKRRPNGVPGADSIDVVDTQTSRFTPASCIASMMLTMPREYTVVGPRR